LEKTAERQIRETLFREIYLSCRNPVDFFLRTWCPDPEARKDLVQDVFVKLYGAMERLDSRRPLKPYLYAIARNRGSDWLRDRRNRDLSFDEEAETESAGSRTFNPESLFFQNRNQELLAGAIARLAPEKRRLLLLYYYENLKISEIAGILGIPGGTVKYRLHRIRKELTAGPLAREAENE